jgi:hypothetical protein
MLGDSAAARFIAEALIEPFVLLDVGCSGGVAPGWAVFGDKLRAHGFDPAVAEIERLSRAETRPGVRYHTAFVAAPADHPVRASQPGAPFHLRDPSGRLAWTRTAALREAAETGEAPPDGSQAFAYRMVEAAGLSLSPPFSLAAAEGAPETGDERDLARMQVNDWRRARLAASDQVVSLAQFIADEGLETVDFIKIDCDGPDFEILSSLEGTLADKQVLGLCLEVNFIGGAAANHHTFHNTDRFMRQAGYDLMDLSMRRYASSALPFFYAYGYPVYGVSLGGRPYQGDALYARDFGWPDLRRRAAQHSNDKLLKLAAVMALFGRLDQAAEVLIMFRARLREVLDIDRALDLLTTEIQALQEPALPAEALASDYRGYMAAFEADDPRFYGGEGRIAERWSRLQQRAQAAEAQLQATQAALDQALAALPARAEPQADGRRTGPLRRLGRLLRR